MTATRYELEGSKFWEIAVQGKKVTTCFGRVGSPGQVKVKEFARDWEASRYRRGQVASKRKQGYELVLLGLPGPEPAAARNPELEAMIGADPERPEPYMVYADWLQAQGDPRGELISVEHALLQRPRNRALLETRSRLRSPYDEQMRELVRRANMQAPRNEHRIELEWGLGFVRRARLAHDWFGDQDLPDTMDTRRLFATFLSLPSTRLIQDLAVGLWRDSEGQAEYEGVFRALAECRPPALRRLFIGDFTYRRQIEMSWTSLGDVSPIYPALPRLEQLILQGGSVKLQTIDLPRLRHFEIRTGGLSRASIGSVVAARWPELERLVLWFGNPDYGAEGDVEQIAPLLTGEGIPGVRHLSLMNANFADALCRALSGARVLEQLESLDLSKGTMTDEGAAALLGARDRLRRLKRLDVSDNYLTRESKAALSGLGPEVVFGAQREPDVWDDEIHRYVSVGE